MMKVAGKPLHEHQSTRVIDGITTTVTAAQGLKQVGIHEIRPSNPSQFLETPNTQIEQIALPSEFDNYSAIRGASGKHATPSDAGSLPVGSFLSNDDQNFESALARKAQIMKARREREPKP